MADGPIKFVKNIDETLNIVNVSRFGRKFSIVKVPYAFKLLIHELQTMNIQIRIITEDNINNLIPLTASKDIEKLTGKKTLREVHQQNIRNLKESERDIPRAAPRRKKPPTKTPFFQPGIDKELPGGANIFAPPGISISSSVPEEPEARTGSGAPSPEYDIASPEYIPSETSQDSTASAKYNPPSPLESIEVEPADAANLEEESSLLTSIVEEKPFTSEEVGKKKVILK